MLRCFVCLPEIVSSFFGFLLLLLLFICLFVLELHLQYMDAPRLGVESELQLPAYTTATATQDLSRVCNLHQSSRQCWIFHPPSKAWD